MIERHIRVERSARYFVLGEAGEKTRELWVACHGYSQLASSFARPLERLASAARVVVVPEGLSRFYVADPLTRHGPETPVGASWMTREDRQHEIEDYVRYLDRVTAVTRSELPARDVPVTVLGFSQGVATACRWVALGTTGAARLILWGGALPPELDYTKGAALFRGASVTVVAGQRDSVVPLELVKREVARLGEQGIQIELIEYDGGHLLQSATLDRLGATTRGA